MNAFSYSVKPFGERGWIATLSGGDMVARALAANAAADVLRKINGVSDAVAGIDSLVIRFDPAALTAAQAQTRLDEVLTNPEQNASHTDSEIAIPVCYGGEYGPDFDALSTKLRISSDDLIAAHSQQTYRVLTVGFAPGFAYLGPLPDALKTERLATPRTRVPAGSVGIAGTMTGVYALASPGGWPLIGRTPKKLFNAHSDKRFLFSPGASVRFIPVSDAEFKAIEAERP